MPASAQTYAGFRFACMSTARCTYYECNYTTLASCNATASGRAAQCVVNPYFANAGMDGPPVRYRRHRGY